jgi:hypothetical protein
MTLYLHLRVMLLPLTMLDVNVDIAMNVLTGKVAILLIGNKKG